MDMRDDVAAPGGASFSHRTYTTDLTDTEWQQVQHLIEVTQTGPGPRRSVDLRAVLNAVRYKQYTGCQWRNLPADMPPRSTVHGYYRRWNKSGVLQQISALLPQEPVSFGDHEAAVSSARTWTLQRVEQPEAAVREAVSSR
jgi:transposase